MRTSVFLLLLIAVLVACGSGTTGTASGTAGLPRPSQRIPTDINLPSTAPQSDFFYSLPNYSVGETVTKDGYTIKVAGVALDGDQLSIDLELGNESGRPIDMTWAVQLVREGTGYIAPTASPVDQTRPADKQLANGADLGGSWVYDLQGTKSATESSVNLDDYRLLYAPFGWSGPVFVFRLSPPVSRRLDNMGVMES